MIRDRSATSPHPEVLAMSDLSLRGFDKELERRLTEIARRDGVSLNEAALRLLRRGAGLDERESDAVLVGDGLDTFIGRWSEVEEKSLLESIAACESVDEALEVKVRFANRGIIDYFGEVGKRQPRGPEGTWRREDSAAALQISRGARSGRGSCAIGHAKGPLRMHDERTNQGSFAVYAAQDDRGRRSTDCPSCSDYVNGFNSSIRIPSKSRTLRVTRVRP